ncbi:MAG TPA: maleylacetoacetate isomerase [Caulobacteraceae bacterium]|jgi:maleylacetoacetate isomerase
MIRMYGFWRSAASFRVRIALNLKGLAYEETMVDLDAGEQHAPAFLAINPSASVPAVFVDDGPPLTQSLAILEYLDETHPPPPLLPADPRGKARVRSLALIFAADSHPLIVPRVRRYLTEELGVDEAGRAAWIRHWFREGLAQAEARMVGDPATGRFCHGDAPTIADLCLMSQFMGARGFQVTTSDLPTVERIAAACLELDAFARAAPLRQPGAPAAH